jgi:hypothetical protein
MSYHYGYNLGGQGQQGQQGQGQSQQQYGQQGSVTFSVRNLD